MAPVYKYKSEKKGSHCVSSLDQAIRDDFTPRRLAIYCCHPTSPTSGLYDTEIAPLQRRPFRRDKTDERISANQTMT